MNEIEIFGRTFFVSSEESSDHIEEVIQLVQSRIHKIAKNKSGHQYSEVCLLVALDFASLLLKGQRKAQSYQDEVIQKANALFEKIELIEKQQPPHDQV